MHNSLTFWDDNSWMKLMTDFKRTDILLITEYKGKKNTVQKQQLRTVIKLNEGIFIESGIPKHHTCSCGTVAIHVYNKD